MKKILVIFAAMIIIIATLLTGCQSTLESTADSSENETDVVSETNAESVGETTEEIDETDSEEPVNDNLVMVSVLKGETFDPFSITALADTTSMNAVYDTLVKMGEGDVPVPSLAESWLEDEANQTITFTLRQDVYFHNGQQFTSKDVIFSFETLKLIPQNSYLSTYITEMTAPDDFTILIKRATPFSKIYNLLYQILIVSQDWYTEVYTANPDDLVTTPCGSGPYLFEGFGEDGSIYLTANESYFNGVPEFTNITVRPPLDSATTVAAMEAGEVDMAMWLPAVQLQLFEGNEEFVVEETNAWTINALTLTGGQLSDDINLRKALFHAINRENAVIFAAEGEGSPATELFSVRTMGDYAGLVTFTGYDKDLALDFLANSNYDSSAPLVLSTTADKSMLAQSIQEDFKEIGVDIEIELLEINAWVEKYINAEFDMTLVGFGTNLQVAEDMLNGLTAANDMYNTFGAKSPEYEALMVEMNQTIDLDQRREIVKEAMEMQLENSYIVPIFEGTANIVYSKRIANIIPLNAAADLLYLGDLKIAQ